MASKRKKENQVIGYIGTKTAAGRNGSEIQNELFDLNWQMYSYQQGLISDVVYQKSLGEIEWFIADLSCKGGAPRRNLEAFKKMEGGGIFVSAGLVRMGSVRHGLELVNDLLAKGVRVILCEENLDMVSTPMGENIDQIIRMLRTMEESCRRQSSNRGKSARLIEKLRCQEEGKISSSKRRGPRSSPLDSKREEIEKMLKKRVSMAAISRILGVSERILRYHAQIRGLKKLRVREGQSWQEEV